MRVCVCVIVGACARCCVACDCALVRVCAGGGVLVHFPLRLLKARGRTGTPDRRQNVNESRKYDKKNRDLRLSTTATRTHMRAIVACARVHTHTYTHSVYLRTHKNVYHAHLTPTCHVYIHTSTRLTHASKCTRTHACTHAHRLQSRGTSPDDSRYPGQPQGSLCEGTLPCQSLCC
jgi:hypothetical protein